MKKIAINIDVQSDKVTFATDQVLTLQQQLKILKQNLQTIPEGTAQFNTVNKAFNDTKDSLSRVNTKSQELFGTLRLIPGPIGAIASQLDGVIDTFKIFSGFTVSDLKAQFNGLVGDIKDVGKFLGNVTGITKVYTVINNALAASFVKVGVGEAAAAAGARTFAAALTATGVGAIVVALGLAVSALMEWVSASDEATTATEQLNNELENQKELLTLQAASYKRNNALILAQLKARGASETEIRNEQIRQAQVAVTNAQNAELEANKQYNANLGKVNKEGLDKLGKQQTDAIEARRNAENDLRLLQLGFQAEDLETAREKEKKKTETILKEAEKRRLRQLEAQQTLREGLENIDVKRVSDIIKNQKNVQATVIKGVTDLSGIQQTLELNALESGFVQKLISEEQFELRRFEIREKYAKDAEELSNIRLDREKYVAKQIETYNNQVEASNAAIQESYFMMADSVGSALRAIASVFGEGTTASKVFGIASVVVNAASAAAQAITSNQAAQAKYNEAIAKGKATILAATPTAIIGNPLAIAQIAAAKAAIAGATIGKVSSKIGMVSQLASIAAGAGAQIAAISNAEKRKDAGTGGGGGGGDTGGGGGGDSTPAFSAPAGPSAPGVEATQAQTGTIAGIVAGSINQNQSQTQPIRAYVVGNEVTTQQQLDRRISTAARLGG